MESVDRVGSMECVTCRSLTATWVRCTGGMCGECGEYGVRDLAKLNRDLVQVLGYGGERGRGGGQ